MATPAARTLEAARSLLLQQAESRGICIECVSPSTDLSILVPRADLLRILGNLIGNAMAVMGNGGRVQVAAETHGEALCALTVRDDGPGFPEGLRDRVFEPGFQIEAHASGSHGLGLSIVRDIAHRHGGTVKVGNHAGGGAEVEVILPRAMP